MLPFSIALRPTEVLTRLFASQIFGNAWMSVRNATWSVRTSSGWFAFVIKSLLGSLQLTVETESEQGRTRLRVQIVLSTKFDSAPRVPLFCGCRSSHLH